MRCARGLRTDVGPAIVFEVVSCGMGIRAPGKRMSRLTQEVFARMRATRGDEQRGQACCSTGTPAETARGKERDTERKIGCNAICDGLRGGTGTPRRHRK